MNRPEYAAPGWDTGNTDSDSNAYDSYNENKINDASYLLPTFRTVSDSKVNSLYATCRTIFPVPSQVLEATYKGLSVQITLDSGATLSFIREELAKDINMPITPNAVHPLFEYDLNGKIMTKI